MTEWNPNLGTVDQPRPDGEILSKAVDKFIGTIQQKLADEHGTFGYITDRGILVAKKYIYGNIVSAHKFAVYSAMNNELPLIMFIKNVDKYYKFEPREIIANSDENEKGGAKMLNWEIGLGEEFK